MTEKRSIKAEASSLEAVGELFVVEAEFVVLAVEITSCKSSDTDDSLTTN